MTDVGHPWATPTSLHNTLITPWCDQCMADLYLGAGQRACHATYTYVLKGHSPPSEPHYSGNVKHKNIYIYTVYPTTTWEQEDIMGQSKWKRIRVCLPSKDRKVSSCVPSSTGLCARSTNSALVVMCEAYKHRDGNLRWRLYTHVTLFCKVLFSSVWSHSPQLHYRQFNFSVIGYHWCVCIGWQSGK